MKSEGSKISALRAAAVGMLASLLVLAACQAELPTSVEVEDMDVAAAEEAARKAGLLTPRDDQPVYTIDGIPVTAEKARAVAPDRIARIEVVRGAAQQGGEIRITTRDPAGELRERTSADQDSVVPVRSRTGNNMAEGFAGLVIIDGERADVTAMRALPVDRIERVEILKGSAATRAYADPAAARGVIRITTRGGSSEPRGG